MRRLKFLLAVFGAGLLFAACDKSEAPAEGQKPLILVSIAPYQFLAERVAGNSFTVQTVVPKGSNPHTYEPTSKQVAAIGKGSVWFLIGEPFEKRVLSVLKARNPELVSSDLRHGIDLIDDHDGCVHCSDDHHDRHIWLSPKSAAAQAQAIAETLAERYPEGREEFFENAKALGVELASLDREIADTLESVQDRVLLVSHPAFGYFCRDYDIEQLSVEFEGKDPRPKHLEAIVRQAIEKRAELALALPQHNNKGAQMIAERLHVPVRVIDPYSSDYFETMRKLAQMIADPRAEE